MILLTGASGFIGNHFAKQLVNSHNVKALVRKENLLLPAAIKQISIEDTSKYDFNDSIFNGIDTVIHCAGMAHKPISNSLFFQNELYIANVLYTKKLAKQASNNNVKHFIFLSSSKVHGEFSEIGTKFSESDDPNPSDIYAFSKLEAEECLKSICLNGEMKYTILRPPLVYGLGVKANFKLLYLAAKYGLPLPLRQVNNLRSLISIENLTSALYACLRNSNLNSSTYLVSDDDDISTPELFNRICRSIGKKCNMFYCKEEYLDILFKFLRSELFLSKITQSFCLNIEKIKYDLDYKPVSKMETTLSRINTSYKF